MKKLNVCILIGLLSTLHYNISIADYIDIDEYNALAKRYDNLTNEYRNLEGKRVAQLNNLKRKQEIHIKNLEGKRVAQFNNLKREQEIHINNLNNRHRHNVNNLNNRHSGVFDNYNNLKDKHNRLDNAYNNLRNKCLK